MLLSTLQRRAGLQSSGDYTGYRKYATRRLKKLRQRANLTVKSTKTYNPQPLGPGQWEIALLLTERDWSAAMTAKAALEADAASAAMLQSQITSKLAKAVKYSSDLLAAQPSDITPQEQLEFAVYAALVSGETALEKQQWSKITTEFSKVRVGLVALIKPTSAGTAEQVYNDLLTTKVDPALRVALAQEKRDFTGDLAEVARRTVQTEVAPEFADLVGKVNPKALSQENATSKLSSIQFRQHTAQVRYNSLAENLLSVRAKDDELNTKVRESDGHFDGSVFDGVMTEWDQLDFTTSSLIAELNSTGQAREQDLDIISTYAKFNLLNRRIQRDALVASKEVGKTNAIRLYDVVLQSCTAMAELPGVYNDDELMAGISGMQKYFETKRTLAVAALHPTGSLEALALVDLAYKRLVRGVDGDGDSTMDSDIMELPVSPEQISELKSEVAKQLSKTYGLTVIYQEVKNRSLAKGSVASDLSFVQIPQDGSRLQTLDLEAKNIDPVPVKPVFYDIAYNYLHETDSTPTSSDSNASANNSRSESAENETPKKKKGLFGIF